jgi:indolepyruvate ferredoxin oxidoreductase beta subunit
MPDSSDRPQEPRPISILIAALGGQGGGVLTEWLVGAAAHAGYPAQATSIPGVAQRTGATTYYVEVFPERLASGSAEPVFSLYPMPGDVDVILASEFLEAGRTLETDCASPERTTLIASTHRLFAIGEKSALGDGVFPRERVEDAARKLTRRLIVFDALEVARRAQSEVNAVLLGALAAARILPMTPSAFEAAIREGGVAMGRNLAGFTAGMEVVESGADRPPPLTARPSWADIRPERAMALGRAGAAFGALADRVETDFAADLHRTLGEAVARLIDYQDAKYAELFLDRVRRVRAVDRGTRLTEIYARRLAVWMAYEDAVRVADLKTRRARFERIRQDNGVTDGAAVQVTDYLKPDLDEIYGILPAAIGAPIARWAERRWPQSRPTLAQHVRTTTVLGFLRVWALGRLRVLRPSSLRYQRESALMSRWERAVLEAAALDQELAVEVAELARVVKGYGEVRRRLARALDRLLDEVVPGAVASARESGPGYAQAAQIVRDARQRILEDDRAVDALLAPAATG